MVRLLWLVVVAAASAFFAVPGQRSMRPMACRSDDELARLSPSTLAYVGDAVYEVFMRTEYAWPPKSHGLHQKKVLHLVRAETQAKVTELLLDGESFPLCEREKLCLRRGRNAASRSPRRLDLAVYQKASALECLIGYLHLSNKTRCNDLLTFIVANTPP